MTLGSANVEMGDEFEIFGFAMEDGWIKIRWSDPIHGMEETPLFMKMAGAANPVF